MSDPVYTLARRGSSMIFDRLSQHRAELGGEERSDLAPMPEPRVIESLVGAAFWASLRREEGRWPTISLAWLPSGAPDDAMVLDRPVPFDPGALTRLAPAVERPGIHLGVWGNDGDLSVWGATRRLPELCLVIETVEPGVVVTKYNRGGGRAKFGNLAVFEGHSVKVVDDAAARGRGALDLLSALTTVEDADAPDRPVDALVQLALSMRAHGHGGTLLVVPEGSGWQRSIVAPIPYRMATPFARVAQLVNPSPSDAAGEDRLDDLRLAIAGLAGLTAVDGATVMNDRLELLAFGAKIRRPHDAEEVEEVRLLEPIAGHQPAIVGPDTLGGTRHLSAAQFAHDQREALALVASQDGPFTIFRWSRQRDQVEAYRIEALLL